MKKTVVIWDSVTAEIEFFVTDKPVSHLDRKYVNSVEISDAYYKNIDQIVAGLSGKVTKLGKENSSMVQALLKYIRNTN